MQRLQRACTLQTPGNGFNYRQGEKTMNLKSTKADIGKRSRLPFLPLSALRRLPLPSGPRPVENRDTGGVNSPSPECAPPIELHACNAWRAEIRRHFNWR